MNKTQIETTAKGRRILRVFRIRTAWTKNGEPVQMGETDKLLAAIYGYGSIKQQEISRETFDVGGRNMDEAAKKAYAEIERRGWNDYSNPDVNVDMEWIR